MKPTLPPQRPCAVMLLTVLIAAMTPSAQAQTGYGQSAPRQIEVPKADAAKDAPAETVRAAIAKPLQAAEKLANEKKHQETLDQLAIADKVEGKTAYEQYLIDRMRAVAALGVGNDALAVKSLESAYASGRIAPADKLNFLDGIARIHYRLKNYPQTVVWASQAVKEPGARIETRLLLGHSAFLTNDFATAYKEISAVIADAEQAAKPVPEDQMRLLASAAQKSNNTEAYVAALEKLVVAYPNKDYWADLIYRVESKKGFADRHVMDVYRLKLITGVMAEPADFLEMAQQALQAGYPAEAQKVIDAGTASGALGKDGNQERQKKLRDTIAKELAEERARAAKPVAPPTRTGLALINNGFDSVIKGEAKKGLEMMEAGLKMSDLKRPDDAKLRYGIAQVLAGQKPQAVEAFKTVQGTDGAADLARVWRLFASSASK